MLIQFGLLERDHIAVAGSLLLVHLLNRHFPLMKLQVCKECHLLNVAVYGIRRDFFQLLSEGVGLVLFLVLYRDRLFPALHLDWIILNEDRTLIFLDDHVMHLIYYVGTRHAEKLSGLSSPSGEGTAPSYH